MNRARGEAARFCERLLGQLGARSVSSLDAPLVSPAIVLADAAQGSEPPPQGNVALSIISGLPVGGTLGSISLEEGIPAALAGAHAAVVALAAWRRAAASGRSARIEVSILEVLATCLGDDLPAAVCPRASHRPPPARSTDPFVLRCTDGYVGLAIPTPEHRALLAAMIAAAGADPTMAGAAWAAQRTRIEAFHEAQLWRLPAAPVLAVEEAQRDEQALARDSWETDAAGELSPRSPFRFQDADEEPTSRDRGARHHLTRDTASDEIFTPTFPRRGGGSFQARGGALPLSGLTVLDLGLVWAGPHCGELLTALGATVVKVERPTRPDGPRPPDGWDDCSGAFADLNRGKLSLAIDLAAPEGRDAFLRLVERADVLVENFSPRVMLNLGLDWPTIRGRNPRLVALSMPAFGSDGPWANAASYGSGLELASGLWAIDDTGTPRAAPIPYLDYLAGTLGAAAVITALIARDADGVGVRVELAQREAAFQLLAGGAPPVQRGPALAVDATAVARRLGEANSDLLRTTTTGPCAHFARPPWRVYDLAAPEAAPAPALGQHSRMVLSALGSLDPDTIESLVRSGVVLDRAEANPQSSTP